MTTLEIIELAAIITVGIGLGIFYLVKAIRNNWLKQLTQTVEEAISTAEKTHRSGPAKKDFVLQAVETKCVELGIPYKTIKSLISKLVDKIISNYNVIKKGK